MPIWNPVTEQQPFREGRCSSEKSVFCFSTCTNIFFMVACYLTFHSVVKNLVYSLLLNNSYCFKSSKEQSHEIFGHPFSLLVPLTLPWQNISIMLIQRKLKLALRSVLTASRGNIPFQYVPLKVSQYLEDHSAAFPPEDHEEFAVNLCFNPGTISEPDKYILLNEFSTF